MLRVMREKEVSMLKFMRFVVQKLVRRFLCRKSQNQALPKWPNTA